MNPFEYINLQRTHQAKKYIYSSKIKFIPVLYLHILHLLYQILHRLNLWYICIWLIYDLLGRTNIEQKFKVYEGPCYKFKDLLFVSGILGNPSKIVNIREGIVRIKAKYVRILVCFIEERIIGVDAWGGMVAKKLKGENTE